jgi:hypothetical protein
LSFAGLDDHPAVVRGMSLRDYFAAAAMQALLARGWLAGDGATLPYVEDVDEDYENENLPIGTGCLARDSYRAADAMLAERSRANQPT